MKPGNASATPISAALNRGWRKGLRPLAGPCLALILQAVLLCAAPAPPKKPADIPMPTLSAKFSDTAQIKLINARKKFQADTNSTPAAWALGQACFWRGEFAGDDEERTALANEGIAVCRPLTIRAPTVPEGHYYLAMNLGQLARTKWLEALGLVKELERGLKLAGGMNPRLDHAGPDRCLGLLYRDAPGWPISVGSKSKARTHLLRAVELAPQFPENHLVLIETWVMWKEKKTLQRDLDTLAGLLPKARKQLTGADWAAHWDDWERRWQEVQAKAAELLRKK
ncbi:MAG: hypothetical protein FD161_1586 [Limisphaerales bacterium]|nr:MAG: hypothetical protein FD161_1586 [Limisphaerales bacterium]KAG0509400.1 MAG: hypothetical protein E1N63_1505 [Limisphaerales bacterium]TXT52145.1 MAG: hypothetical protein FD140_1078 [Limisphaerales bacterium]